MLQPIYVQNARGECKLAAEEYEFERTIQTEVEGEVQEWSERVRMVRSEAYQYLNGKIWKPGCNRPKLN